MRVSPGFGRFIENLSAITRCPLYRMSTIEKFNCISNISFYYEIHIHKKKWLITCSCNSSETNILRDINFDKLVCS